MLAVRKSAAWWTEQGSIQIDCDFCHSKYVFDETDVNALFGADVVNAVRQENERLQ